jgi:cytochrome c-type biogenesis protein CcmF
MGNVHNPDTRNLFSGDVFMYLTFAEDLSKRMADGYALSDTREVSLSDSIVLNDKVVVFDSLDISMKSQEEFVINAMMKTTDSLGNQTTVALPYKVNGNVAESGIIEVEGTSSRIKFDKVSENPKAIYVSIYEKQPEFIVLKIMFFPYIWVLWAGSILLFVGLGVSFFKRVNKLKAISEK